MATGEDSDSRLLRRLAGSIGGTGPGLFASLARALGETFDCRLALLAEVPEDGAAGASRARSLGAWGPSGLLSLGDLELAGSFGEAILRDGALALSRGAQERFPRDPLLAEHAVAGCHGVPFAAPGGAPLGFLAVFDGKPLVDDARRLPLLELCAARATAELERRRVEEQLRRSERRFRDLFEEAPIAYVYEDTDTRFVSANRAFMRLLGLRPEEVPGMLGRSLLAPTSETQGRVDDAFADIQQGKERGSIELELRRKDNGEPVFVQFWSRPEPDGKHTRTMLIDITDRVRAEQERNRLRHQNRYLQEEIRTEYNFEEIVGGAPSLRAALSQVERVAPTDSTVLLLGETGTGKELIARALHHASRRSDRPLIKLNCSALPTGLIESELFGHEKGAFTGALERRVGRFALADGGTIFLDEIGDIPPDVQVRLLRVLQEQEFEPVGSAKTVKVDVRVIAATNRDLDRAVAEGKFRADLFYRLNVFPIRLPPLRERASDIQLLAHYFVRKHGARIGKTLDGIAPETIARLAAYRWPGNIRELENVVERAVILSPGPLLELDPSMLAPPPTADLSDAENQRRHLSEVLEQCGWVIEGARGAARRLGLHPNTLRSRMKKLGVRRGPA